MVNVTLPGHISKAIWHGFECSWSLKARKVPILFLNIVIISASEITVVEVCASNVEIFVMSVDCDSSKVSRASVSRDETRSRNLAGRRNAL